MKLKTTLEQWLTLLEVDKAGSIQAAAQKLHKSHTTLLYAVRKLEDQIGVPLVRIQGRRAVLTEEGKALLRRATPMLEQARGLEDIALQLSQDVESDITVTIDHLCNRQWLYGPLSEFMSHNKGTSVHIRETSLSGTQSAVTEQEADIAIINLPVTNHLAEAFGTVTMIPVVSAQHTLAHREQVCMEDLLVETQIVIRDLGGNEAQVKQDVGWLKAQRRITVDNFDHAITAVQAGLGFCRLPEHMLSELENQHFDNPSQSSQPLVRLPLEGGSQYQVPLHITLPKAGLTGPAAKALYRCLLTDSQKRMDYSLAGT